MLESHILKQIMMFCSRGACRLFRNNSGAFQDKRGQWVRYGVANPGGSDLIGWRSVRVTQDMVGRTLAVFAAIEVKQEKKKPTVEQAQFIEAVKSAGGIAGVAHSPEEAAALLDTLPVDEARNT